MAVDKKISTFSIPLGKPKKAEDLPIGKIIVVESKEICLTCGGKKRMRWIEKVDGNRSIKEVCLFCVTKIHTAKNRADH